MRAPELAATLRGRHPDVVLVREEVTLLLDRSELVPTLLAHRLLETQPAVLLTHGAHAGDREHAGIGVVRHAALTTSRSRPHVSGSEVESSIAWRSFSSP